VKRSLYQVRDCPACREEKALFLRCAEGSHEWRCMSCNCIRDDRDWDARAGFYRWNSEEDYYTSNPPDFEVNTSRILEMYTTKEGNGA